MGVVTQSNQERHAVYPQAEKITLTGTTLRVYRHIFKSKNPIGAYDVQRGLGLSSPSVALYHLKKLTVLGLIREVQEGFVIDRVLFDNIVRIGRVAVPTQSAYVAFFAISLVMLLTLFRPLGVDSTYVFSLVVAGVGLLISLYEVNRSLGRVFS